MRLELIASMAAISPPPLESAELQASADDRDSLRRALRDLEAAELRVQKNAERVYEEARQKLVFAILPVLDDLDRAIRAGEAEASTGLLEGVRLVRARLQQVLVGYGVEIIEAYGLAFDPSVHEAVTAVPVYDPRMHHRVVEQLEPGYRYGERVLRPAKVAVGVLQRR